MASAAAPDWGVLARALAAEGEDAARLYEATAYFGCAEHGPLAAGTILEAGMTGPQCPRCLGPLAIARGRRPVRFDDPEVIFPLAEAWRRRDVNARSYTMRSASGDPASAQCWAPAPPDASGNYTSYERGAWDDPASLAEALARALLAWAEDEEVRDGE